jgi:hypothetical protein
MNVGITRKEAGETAVDRRIDLSAICLVSHRSRGQALEA